MPVEEDIRVHNKFTIGNDQATISEVHDKLLVETKSRNTMLVTTQFYELCYWETSTNYGYYNRYSH